MVQLIGSTSEHSTFDIRRSRFAHVKFMKIKCRMLRCGPVRTRSVSFDGLKVFEHVLAGRRKNSVNSDPTIDHRANNIVNDFSSFPDLYVLLASIDNGH